MALFIKGMACISPQKTWDVAALPDDVVNSNSDRLTAIEPDYSQYIDPKHIRRMSRIIKFGVSAATLALRQAKVAVPDAIITGTGYGCLEDTGTFLSKMVENNELALNPTPFIQSTHNTIGSQIALLLQCQGYNQTYAHGAFSFESTLLDALIQLEDDPEKNVLIGGVDEITDISHTIQQRFGMFEPVPNGEGSSFFVVGASRENAIASVDRVDTFYKPPQQTLHDHIKSFSEIDLVVAGSTSRDGLQLLQHCQPDAAIAQFKHLSGEYPVASAFAVWLGATILKTQRVPDSLVIKKPTQSIKRLLIINDYFQTHYSSILMTVC
jgi:3-oxoacyl-[acyl-carrier-protein] synthase II